MRTMMIKIVFVILTFALGCAYKMPRVENPSDMVPECEALRGQDDSGGDMLTSKCYVETAGRKIEVRRRVQAHEERQARARPQSGEYTEQTLKVDSPFLDTEVKHPALSQLVMATTSIPVMKQRDRFAIVGHDPRGGCRAGKDVWIENECGTARLHVLQNNILKKCSHGNLVSVWGETVGGGVDMMEMIPPGQTGYFQIADNVTFMVKVRMEEYTMGGGEVRQNPANPYPGSVDILPVPVPFTPRLGVRSPTRWEYGHGCGAK